MGADEAYHLGVCNATQQLIRIHGSQDRAVLSHLSRIARYIQTTYNVGRDAPRRTTRRQCF